MVSKKFLLIALAFATLLLIASQVAAAEESTSNTNNSEVEDAEYGMDDYYDGYGYRGRGRYYRRGRGYCYFGCCGGGGYYRRRCRCCRTLEEANAYEQAQMEETHN